MRRILTKILGIIFVLILGYQKLSYADVIMISDPIDNFRPIAFLVGAVGITVLVISAISFLTLKTAVNKQNNSEISYEQIENKKSKIGRRFYIWGMILSIVVLIYVILRYETSMLILIIPVVLFVISIITRVRKNNKVSNIILVISITLNCIISLGILINGKMIENYNNKFLQYRNEENSVSDLNGLINTAIENNRSGRKVTLVYQHTNYTSIDELKDLLNKLNIRRRYIISYRDSEDYYIDDYIQFIILEPRAYEDSAYEDSILNGLFHYEGKKQNNDVIELLIKTAIVTARECEYMKFSIIYNSGTEEKAIVEVNENNAEEISNLMEQISSEKKYDVEIQTESDKLCNIIITSNK